MPCMEQDKKIQLGWAGAHLRETENTWEYVTENEEKLGCLLSIADWQMTSRMEDKRT